MTVPPGRHSVTLVRRLDARLLAVLSQPLRGAQHRAVAFRGSFGYVSHVYETLLDLSRLSAQEPVTFRPSRSPACTRTAAEPGQATKP